MSRALLHIVRSHGGVTHVDASPGIGVVDAAELERLPLGSLATPREIARLASVPTVFGRRLRSGRYAVTRILPAPPDDGGPESIDAISLVMPSLAYAQVAGALAQIALDERFWKIARLAVARGVDLPEAACATPATDPRALRAFDAWIAARRRQGVAVLPPEDAVGILAMAGWLDADDCAECRWGIGVLTLDAPVDICTISPIAGLSAQRPIVQPSVGEAWLSTEMEHAVWHLSASPRFPPLRTLVSSVRIESARDSSATRATPSREAGRSSGGLAMAVLAGIASVALAAVLLRSTDSSEAGTGADAGTDAARSPSRSIPLTSAESGDGPVESVPVRTPAQDSVLRPGHSDAGDDLDGDGFANDVDCERDDPTRGAMQVFYRDFDGDGAGDPNPSLVMKLCVVPTAPAPEGYSRRNDDLCDQNPALTSNGGCPCHWQGPIEDRDRNGILDCLDDLDHDGTPLADDLDDGRQQLCREAADSFTRARRELAFAFLQLDEIEKRARVAAADKILKGDALRRHERMVVEPHMIGIRDAIRQGLWEVYVARRTIVFGDESFTPRSRWDPAQSAPDVFPVAKEEQFGLLRLFLEDLDRVTARYARAYARYIHMGRPTRLIREDLEQEVLAHWTTGSLGQDDSLEAMRWVSGLVTKTDDELDKEIRRIDEQLRRGRAAASGR
jgi:hypothetical protein